MTTTTKVADPGSFLETRTAELFQEQERRVHHGANRVFFWLLLAQWAFAIAISIVWSPYGWEGKVRSTHVHVPAAIILGAILNSLPLALLKWRPDATYTRHVVTAAQMMWSALLIHLTGGRIETHFHVFGSLAFLAFYRDWKLFPTATIVVSADHLLRGILWPESVYGIANPEWWRFLEHAWWVVFEDVILVMACLRGVQEMRLLARGRAEVESQQGALVRSEKLIAIGSLAASVGHELRNPLASVKGAMGYISKRLATVKPGEALESDPKLKEFLGLVDRELVTCSRIITDLLDFARDRPLLRGPSPLAPLVADALAAIPARNGVTVVNSVPADFPVPILDKVQFTQVITVLAQNALEAIDDAGTVEISARREPNGRCVVVVSDDGCGIPADALAKVFQPLFTTKQNRTGLGLAIASNILERHGASITATSEPGKGTKMTISLPFEDAQQVAA